MPRKYSEQRALGITSFVNVGPEGQELQPGEVFLVTKTFDRDGVENGSTYEVVSVDIVDRKIDGYDRDKDAIDEIIDDMENLKADLANA